MRCRNCGGFVTSEFARVFGGNHDDVHGCLECMSVAEICAGMASGGEHSPSLSAPPPRE